jgi:hypothetical protein
MEKFIPVNIIVLDKNINIMHNVYISTLQEEKLVFEKKIYDYFVKMN